MNNRSILLIMAMKDEAINFINRLNLKEDGNFPLLGSEVFSGYLKECKINLVLSGFCKKFSVDQIGSQAATLITQLSVERYKPSIVVNAGTAGGFLRHNAKIGDVYIGAPYACFHDRRIDLPNFDRYGIGYYPCMPCEAIVAELELKSGVVCTGNSLDYTEKDLEIIHTLRGEVKEMEAAAIAWIAQLHGIPFVAIKAITDLVDGEHPTEEEFLRNLNFASKVLSEKTCLVLERLAVSI